MTDRKLPSGRSRVLLGVLTTGRLLRCFPPRRNPVLEVSTSDMIPGSSSNSIAVDGGGYPRGRGDWNVKFQTRHEAFYTFSFFFDTSNVNSKACYKHEAIISQMLRGFTFL